MESMLIDAGLTDLQARAYLYLLDGGDVSPPGLPTALKMTRSNAYKVLDSLELLGLVSRHEVRKKFVYKAADPSALSAIVAQKRNEVLALEKSVSTVMRELRRRYNKHNPRNNTVTRHGKQRMIEAYAKQAKQKQDIYFIKARSDIPFMGFETMNEVRHLANKTNVMRYGITPDGQESSANPRLDQNTRLIRTWVDATSYTAPVEWSACGDNLILQVFDHIGRVVIIEDVVIADAFRQIWRLLDESLRMRPDYAALPKLAERKV